MTKHANQSAFVLRPPVVAVLGHVDHGKTSLLDYIRESNVASRESGGITQHIGAYQVNVEAKKTQASGTPKYITFIDTPGHEAFAQMRSRGAHVADIALLVVAADDSVKPQTVESIRQIKEAGIPYIVVINKMDLETANVTRVKQDLAKHSVQLEGFGGDIPFAEVSAKTGKGINELLELIWLLWNLNPQETDPSSVFEGSVIETQIDKGKGMVATVIVKSGNLRYATPLFIDEQAIGKVRAIQNEFGKSLQQALPGTPVQVLGFTQLPPVGSVVAEVAKTPKVENASPAASAPTAIPDFLKPIGEVQQKLTVLLKTDTAGSLEAIQEMLSDKVALIGIGYGEITEADILTARSSGAFIVGFNVGIKASAVILAESEKVVYRTYKIIYELLDELNDVVLGMKEVVSGEREVGQARIIAEFPFDNDRIAGVKVKSGRVAKGDLVKIMRGEAEVGRAKIKSVRQGKLEVTKVEEGQECGVFFDKPVAFSLQDDIIAVIK